MIEDIKEKIDKSKEIHRYNITYSREWFENLLTYIINLQQRIDKAIEYIKNEMPYLQEVDEIIEDMNGNDYCKYKEWTGQELLEILGDKENE